MILKKKIYKNLPLLVNRWYHTKMQTRERVLIKEIRLNKNGEQDQCFVIYENAQHLGLCPLQVERIEHDKQEINEINICSHCGEPI